MINPATRRHPPIPPNCDWFFEDEGKWFFTLPQSGRRNGWIAIEVGAAADMRDPRTVIAVVAKSAWEDEYDKWDKLDAGELSEMDADPRGNARKNAAAWAAWGKA